MSVFVNNNDTSCQEVCASDSNRREGILDLGLSIQKIKGGGRKGGEEREEEEG
jgi:hypothetical protein